MAGCFAAVLVFTFLVSVSLGEYTLGTRCDLVTKTSEL